jgi:hypothetical protein
VAYRYSALARTLGWQPTADLSGAQQWDRFSVVDSTSAPIGELQRVSRFYTASLSLSRPRVRSSASLAFGAQLETRDYSTTPATLINGLDPVFARGRQRPSVFVSGFLGNTMSAGRSISLEDGVSASGTVVRGWQSGALERESWRATGTVRGYRAFGTRGFARQVLAFRASGGITDEHASTELSIGGVSGARLELVPGVLVGDPSRLFPVRGFAPGVQRGVRAASLSLEHRVPVALVARGLGLWPVFLDRVSFNSFGDAGRAWCPSAVREAPGAGALCFPAGVRDGWLGSVGAELTLDLGIQWDSPLRARLGVAQPVLRPNDVSRGTAWFFTLGSSF